MWLAVVPETSRSKVPVWPARPDSVTEGTPAEAISPYEHALQRQRKGVDRLSRVSGGKPRLLTGMCGLWMAGVEQGNLQHGA